MTMHENQEKYEIWGTFSVMDHTPIGAFLAEVVMYDKLVIPVPPDPALANTDDEREFAVNEWKRWQEKQWNPQRQRQLLNILKPIAIEVPWDRQRQGLWQSAFERDKQKVSQEVNEFLAGWKTGETLLDDIAASASGVIAVSPYKSLDELESTLDISKTTSSFEEVKAGQGLPGSIVSAIVGREFTVPDADDRDEFSLLEEAVEVVCEADYREARSIYHKSLLRFIRNGKTDYKSIASAVEDMNESLEKIQQITDKKKRWKRLEQIFLFTQVAVDLALATINPFAASKAAITLGKYTISEQLRNPNDPYNVRPHAALFHDVQRRLGLDFSERSG